MCEIKCQSYCELQEKKERTDTYNRVLKSKQELGIHSNLPTIKKTGICYHGNKIPVFSFRFI